MGYRGVEASLVHRHQSPGEGLWPRAGCRHPRLPHAEAWAKRLARQGGAQRQLLTDELGETWAQAGRWIGPDDDKGYRAAMAEGIVTASPAQIRETVRRWLVELLAAEGVELDLPEPEDWSGWDPATRRWDP